MITLLARKHERRVVLDFDRRTEQIRSWVCNSSDVVYRTTDCRPGNSFVCFQFDFVSARKPSGVLIGEWEHCRCLNQSSRVSVGSSPRVLSRTESISTTSRLPPLQRSTSTPVVQPKRIAPCGRFLVPHTLSNIPSFSLSSSSSFLLVRKSIQRHK